MKTLKSQSAQPAQAPVPLHRQGSQPSVTLVVASVATRARLGHRLATIVPLAKHAGAEILVIRAAGAAELASLEAAYPEIRFIQADVQLPPAELRSLGAREASGDLVVFTADTSDAAGSWRQLLLDMSSISIHVE